MPSEEETQIQQITVLGGGLTLLFLLLGFFYPAASAIFYSLSIVGIVVTAVAGSEAVR